ncbi:MAG: ABC transporter substrate-binding protein, partial [Gemmatimonadetes bacterium]|nr:ABC transporter substrate-binding protein [Gemmatimonadota bacterium]
MMSSGSARRSALRTTAVAAICFVLAACGDDADRPSPFDAEVPEADRYGGTAVFAGSTDIQTFNPVATADEFSDAVQRELVLMTLLRLDEDLEPIPYLAESWEINADSTRVEFRLRDDIAWEDGEPTTVWDVEYTFSVLKDPESAFPNAENLAGWEGPEVIDERTIRFAVRPHAGLLYGWTRLPILPRHVVADTRPGQLATHEFGIRPTGNGPYRLVEARDDDTWIFEATLDFPAELGGRPYLDRLVYRSLPEPATQLAELRSGGAHLVRIVSPSQLRQVREARELSALEYPTRAYGFIAWNGVRPPFDEPVIRRALTMAIDRQALVDVVREGLGEIPNGPIGSWHPAYDAELAPLPFAPDSAAAALERAGWSDRDEDGIREDDEGALSFELLTSERETYRAVAEIVQAQLRAVGLDVAIRSLEASAFLDAIPSPERRFDAFVLEWEPGFEIDD